jgi:NAD-dependent deacetylase
VGPEIDATVELLRETGLALAFTGAGISTESGIPDFRGPNGIWNTMDPDEFTIERFLADPEVRKRRWRLHQQGKLWGSRGGFRPNAGHLALVDLWKDEHLAGCVTQNVDGLHVAAGLPEEIVAEIHGHSRVARCLDCDSRWPIEEVLLWVDAGEQDPHCPGCNGIVKTVTVMFGENLPPTEMEKAWRLADSAGAVLAIGSTLSVWPAADIPFRMALAGKPLVIINQGATELDDLATIRIEGGAGPVLTELTAALSKRTF